MKLTRRLLAVALVAPLVFGSSTRIARVKSTADPSEEAVAVAISGGEVSGTLLLPSGAGPFPVALIVAGSGPIDRDGNSNAYGLATDAYKKLAQALATRNIATSRYDTIRVVSARARRS